MSDSALAVLTHPSMLTPVEAVIQAKAMYQITSTVSKEILKKGMDYGDIPGTNKPTLLKPGAEKLCAAFGYYPKPVLLEKMEKWDPIAPMFHYRFECQIIRINDGKIIASATGSCNSMEKKYRWRWVDEADLPPGIDKSGLLTQASSKWEFDFAINKAETTGKYGKPAEHWQEFKDAIASGKAKRIQKPTKSGVSDAWEISSVIYRIPNDDIFTLVNTLEKMAFKRSFIAATLIATGASEFFNQDMEDLRDFSNDFLEGDFEEMPPEPKVDPFASAKQTVAQEPPLEREAFIAKMVELGLKSEAIGQWLQEHDLLSVTGDNRYNVMYAYAKEKLAPKTEPVLKPEEIIPANLEVKQVDIDKLAEGIKATNEAVKNGAGIEEAVAQQVEATNGKSPAPASSEPPPHDPDWFDKMVPPMPVESAPATSVFSQMQKRAAEKQRKVGQK